MSVPVHIHCSLRKEELLPAATLVANSLRVGFPTARLTLWLNHGGLFTGIREDYPDKVVREAYESVVNDVRYTQVNHHEWILQLLERYEEPFFICDTDVVFWRNFEQFDFSGHAMAGRFIPQFHCAFAKATSQPRLHTSLLFLDPAKINAQVVKFGEQFPYVYCLPRPSLQDLVYPRYVPTRNYIAFGTTFFDTCALLWAAIGGEEFNEEQNLAFDHLNFGTLSDQVAPHYPEEMFRETHFAIFENPQLLKGAWARQKEWYRRH